MMLVGGCNKSLETSGTCGATVAVLGAEDGVVSLAFENTAADTIEIGGSMAASFVDATGSVMKARMRPAVDDNWFMPFKLPPKSRRQVTVALEGGNPTKLDRIEIPHSGSGAVPLCTAKLSGLAK